MRPTMLLSMSTMMLLLSAVATRDGTCDVENLAGMLATNKYLLYGLTADCQLFFATNVPDGTDIGEHFSPKPMFEDAPISVDERNRTQTFDCSNATLQPLRDSTGKLRLLLIFRANKRVYATVHDFVMPQMGAWFITSSGRPVIECSNEKMTCQTEAQILSNQVDYMLFNKYNNKTEHNPGIMGFIAEHDSTYYLIKPDKLLKKNQYAYTLEKFVMDINGKLKYSCCEQAWTTKDSQWHALAAQDFYTEFIYFHTQNIMERYPLSDVLQETFDLYGVGYLRMMSLNKNVKRYDLGKYSIAYNRVLGMQETKWVGEQMDKAEIYVETITTDSKPSFANRVCIGRLRRPANPDDFYIHYNRLANFQIHVLFQEHYDEVLAANSIAPAPNSTTRSSSNVSKRKRTIAAAVNITDEPNANPTINTTAMKKSTTTSISDENASSSHVI